MNIYMLLGDITHLATIIGLLAYIWRKRTSSGISGRTQILFALVFATRYIDLFMVFISVYNSCMKIVFLAVTFVTVLSIYCLFKDPDTRQHDTFRSETLIVGAAIIAFFVHYEFTVKEVLWSFSEFLEVVAIIPQLHMVSKVGKSEKYIDVYIYGLAQYRVFYVVNWGFRYYYENYYDLLSTVPGIIQVLIYFDYFFALFSAQIINKYRKCATDDLSMKPVYVISSNDLPPVKSEKPCPEEKV